MAAAAGQAPSMPSASSVASRDLLVVGPGVLGSVTGALWKQQFSDAAVVGQTNTTNSHERLQQLGFAVRTGEQADGSQFDNVLFAAPPSGSADYVGQVRAALRLWSGAGCFVFTGSFSVCAVADNGEVDEQHCPLVALGASPATDRLLQAEAAVLEAGGCVLRLVGLYHRSRGPHTYFASQREVARPPDYIVNLIHYEDAARLALSILRGDGGDGTPYRGRVFFGCDGQPITFQDMMDACFASGVCQGSVVFTGKPGSALSKRVRNNATRAQLQWTPLYQSFKTFCAAGGHDLYSKQAA